MKKKIKISDIFAYLQGYYRYHLFYSKHFKWLIRKHIYDQIVWRISIMNLECYTEGCCKLCGCDTTALQMADKQCKKPCYPDMMNKFDWVTFDKDNYGKLD